ncbi:unnamed protein product [Blepharisma stoltei]|uniref:Uncharacterized protein n=1 Tax=Blepharisma stoltei TaxID=1481888 RepID=A0AAU9KDB6_9CILI|nr:unnamed protein product [Blepharisma stoltei]
MHVYLWSIHISFEILCPFLHNYYQNMVPLTLCVSHQTMQKKKFQEMHSQYFLTLRVIVFANFYLKMDIWTFRVFMGSLNLRPEGL